MKIFINNIELEVIPNTTVLEACSLIGINLPRFCYHQELSISGNCRMCLIEIEKSIKPIAACAMPVVPNMKIFTETPLVKKARESVLEFLLLNHPLDCPICDQGGECDLQDQVFNFGSDKSRFYEKKRVVENKNFGPLIKTIMTRCIHCTRCVRFTSEIAGINIDYLGTVNRGQQTEITTFIQKAILSELSGNLIDLCPVGALTSKPYAFVSRPWELKSIDSIDIFDSLGSSIKIDYKECKIVRILPRFDKFSINKEWITDKIRFSYDSIYINRIIEPLLNNSGYFYHLTWNHIIKKIKSFFEKIHPSKICFVIGNKIDIESIFSLKLLSDNFGISKFIHDKSFFINYDYSNNYTFNLKLIEKADIIFLIGTNPKTEANLLNLQIQQNKFIKNIIIVGSSFDSTYKLNKFISLDLDIFLKILEGLHKYSKILNEAKLPLIIYGSRFLKLQQFVKTINNLNSKIKIINSDFINLIPTDSNNVGNFNLGVSPFIPEILNEVKLFYLVHPSKEFLDFLNNFYKYKNSEKRPIVIYQGTHLPSNEISFINYYLPGKTFFEKEGGYFNIENMYQKSAKIPEINNQTRDDFQIIQIFNEKIINLKNLNKILFRRIPFFSYLKSKLNNKFFDNFNFFYGVKIEQNYIKPIIEDFYLNDIFLLNSIIMGKCSNLYKKNSKNFFI
jgi:NADH-quinone oxidoreductase subunit G